MVEAMTGFLRPRLLRSLIQKLRSGSGGGSGVSFGAL
jgi:hypothetical protein